MKTPLIRLKTSIQNNTYNEDKDTIDYDKITFKEEKVKSNARCIVVYALVLLCIVVLVSFCLNLILPIDWRWLSLEDMENIRGVALTVIGGLAMSLGTTLFIKK